ncbi:MAG TPA: DEAD/DEAH box helicase [bacterium]|nr:DEAD/DEAH box helicase [bacterium]
MPDALHLFHPLIRRWFAERVGKPTDVQARSWPEIARGCHVLITAPTGSGKTLTAFLWSIHQLITEQWPRGGTRVLYVSPLKALNNDIQRNLLGPLAEIQDYFEKEDVPFPALSVLTRSGDTDYSERAKMLRRPPEILITTPESLNLLVSSIQGRKMLTGLRCVILDEIHAVAGNKRGTHLITAVDRLVPLSGEFQRVALSATVKPLEKIAAWVGGFRMENHGPEPRYIPREVLVIPSGQAKRYQVEVRFARAEDEERDEPSMWARMAEELKPIIQKNRSTLIFTNNRRLCERISLLLNQDEPERIAYAHHGSLSRETRLVVEERLKRGELSAIVATGTLELGIDIGALDEVLMVQTPTSIAAGLQRVGRAGHRVGGISRGILFPAHGRDLVESAVMAKSILERDIEPVEPVTGALDVLAQIIVAMTGVERWDIDRLFDFLRTSHPYHALRRAEYDLVLKMLGGHYGGGRLRRLQALVSIDRLENTIRARDGALRLVYSSGGTIPDRGYYTLRHRETHAKIGELDEEFVWERRLGDTFTFGTQTWRIHAITHNDVLAVPVSGKAKDMPFWRAEATGRDFYFAEKIGHFLETANEHVEASGFLESLQREYQLNEPASEALIDFLRNQKEATRSDLPHRHHLLIEYTKTPEIFQDGWMVVLHTGWGGKINRPLAVALAGLWEATQGTRLEVFVNDDGIAMHLPPGASAREMLFTIDPQDLERWLREKLEQTGFFGARFRENAARALLLPRHAFGRRTPLWLNRQRSKELLDAVSRFPDFPIVLETWRECLRDEFDLVTLRTLLQEIREGVIAVTETRTAHPSRFAQSLLWQQTNLYMYDYDDGLEGKTSRLQDDWIKEIVFTADLRPEIAPDLARRFQQKIQRVFPEYAPGSPAELLDWVKERLFIPEAEWRELLQAIQRDSHIDPAVWLQEIHGKVIRITLPQHISSGVVSLEILPRLLKVLQLDLESIYMESLPADGPPPIRKGFVEKKIQRLAKQEEESLAEWLGQWLAYYGPMRRAFLHEVWELSEYVLEAALEDLLNEQRIVAGTLMMGGAGDEICDSENLERLLRLARKEAAPAFETLPADALPLFLASQQRLTHPGCTRDDLQLALEKLLGYTAAANLWETEFLVSRVSSYSPSWMDSLMQETDLIWQGRGKEKITLCFRDQLDLFSDEENELEADNSSPKEENSTGSDAALQAVFPNLQAKYDFTHLLQRSGLSSGELAQRLWDLAWLGQVTNDSFAALRKGIETRFKVAEISQNEARPRRSGFSRWQSTRPFAGNWYALPGPQPPEDAMDELERQKDRVRLLLDRYGILFRDLLARESPAFRWGRLFKALRIMELSGEIVGGYFFEGIPGMQFISPAALRTMPFHLSEEPVFWLNAADPASLCGVSLTGLGYELPERRPSHHLVYHGRKLVMTSRRSGREVEIHVPADDPNLPCYFGLFRDWLERLVSPVPVIVIESINGEDPTRSAYLPVLRELFDTRAEYKKITLRKRYGQRAG